MSAFLQQATALQHAMCKLCFAVNRTLSSIFDNKRADPTGLTALLQSTDLVGGCTLCTASCSTAPPCLSPAAQSPQDPICPTRGHPCGPNGPPLPQTASPCLTCLPFQTVLSAEGAVPCLPPHSELPAVVLLSATPSEELLREVSFCEATA
ncbi:hypothetical protein J4Q44_G00093000 [Coregonus suidteri]|uniref:Uncharacterized protein n=1 Tax=Coregonus suidteri TaxID=861788 RepID=A0AAN8R278_9TELE